MNAFAQERAREKDEAKKAREREPASPTGDTPPAKKGAGHAASLRAWSGQIQAPRTASALMTMRDLSVGLA